MVESGSYAEQKRTKNFVRPEMVKNKSEVEVPETLDITEHMTHQDPHATPVRYRLLHAVYHIGDSIKSGHYVAGVTSAPKNGGRVPKGGKRRGRQWMCNDSHVHPWTVPADVQNKFTVVPLDFECEDEEGKRSIEGGQPYMLWYVRDMALVEAEREDGDVGGIAARVTEKPRQNRGKRVRGG